MYVGMDKQLARIESVSLEIEDHGILTCDVLLNKESGSHQSFGGYCLDGYDEKLKRRVGTAGGLDWILRLMQIFNVNKLEKLKGKMCYALYDTPYKRFSSQIIGLESLNIDGGGSFLISDWQKQWFPQERENKK